MSRKRTINQAELFHETERLILESGYNGFHFKALGERLGVARSTIYNYYTKKEELITDYMIQLIHKAISQIDDARSEKDPLRSLVRIWARYAHMHHMLRIMPYVDHHVSEAAQCNVEEVRKQVQIMKEMLSDIMKEMQLQGIVRTDVALPTLVGFLMASVQVPIQEMSEERWAEDVYTLLTSGIFAKKI